MLCCAQCCVLLTAQTGLIHVCSAAHTVPYARLSEDKYHNVCNELGIRTDYPTSQELDGIKALSELNIYTMALICGVDGCLMIFASRGAMRKHYDVMHKGVPIPTIWHIVSAQRLDNGSHKTYFRVIEPSYMFRPVLNKDWIDILDTQINDAMKIDLLFNSDPRYLNALLTKTKWADHIKGHDLDELRSLVRLPGAEEFPLLKETIEWIFEVVMISIDGTPAIILQRLNTKELAP